MSVKVKWFDSVINNKVNGAKKAYLHGIGQGLVNQLVDLSPVKTGLLRNSMHYRMDDGTRSEFGNFSGPEPGNNIPPSDAVLSKPENDYVKIGSAVIYADRVNKTSRTGSAGYFERAIDAFRSSQAGVRIARGVFKKFFR